MMRLEKMEKSDKRVPQMEDIQTILRIFEKIVDECSSIAERIMSSPSISIQQQYPVEDILREMDTES